MTHRRFEFVQWSRCLQRHAGLAQPVNLLGVRVPAVGQHFQPLGPERARRALGHARKLRLVARVAHDLVVHDQVAVGVHGRLQVVAGRAVEALHQPGIGLCRDVRGAVGLLERLDLLLDAYLLLVQRTQRIAHRARTCARRLVIAAVVCVELSQVARDTLANEAQLLVERAQAHDRFARGHSTQLGAVNGDRARGHELVAARELHERRRRRHQRRALRAAEFRDRLVVGRQPAQHPHHLDVALAFALEPTRRPHRAEVSVQVQLEQVTRVIRRTPSSRSHGLLEAQPRQVQRVDPGIENAHLRVLINQLVQRDSEQRHLRPALPASKAHAAPN